MASQSRRKKNHHHQSSSTIYDNPEDITVSDFVAVKLSGGNHYVWKSMMYNLVKSCGMGDIITDYNRKLDGDWKRKDGIVKRWILSTVNEHIILTIANFASARKMWDYLSDKYSTPESQTIQVDLRQEKSNLQVREASNMYFGDGCRITSKRRTAVGEMEPDSDGENLINRYLPLAKAAMYNDWEKAAQFIQQEPDSVRALITSSSETALMISVRSTGRLNFTKKLVDIMSAEDVLRVNNIGSTALHLAASAENMEAAELLLKKNPKLAVTYNQSKLLPLHEAASNGKKEMVIYLISHSTASDSPYYDDEARSLLLVLLISSGLFGVAISVVQQHPNVVTLRGGKNGPLAMLSRKYSSFPSGERFNFWQRIIYSRVPVNVENEEKHHSHNGDIEKASTNLISVRSKLYQLFWKVAEISVPQIKSIRDKKLIHYQTQQLSKLLVGEIVKEKHSVVRSAIKEPIEKAAAMGIHEVVEDILDMYPGAIVIAELNQTIFHLAAVNRCENLFNIIYQFEDKSKFMMSRDTSGNTILHLACRLEDDQKIKLRATAAGAALQMQRELQWFKEVEYLAGDAWNKEINSDSKTAAVIFSETHQELVKEGEAWMKGTANSCAIVAALIVTVVFAAAITVPGGNNSDTGFPFFAKRKWFIVFAISDVLALFSSTSSLIMFLSILTSRYAEIDFLYSLPKRLIIGLSTLFLSLVFMLIAFSAAVEILFGDYKMWTLIPVVTLASVPVTLFMSLQFSLLVDMIKSTYGSGIFGKQSDRIIH